MDKKQWKTKAKNIAHKVVKKLKQNSEGNIAYKIQIGKKRSKY